MSGKNLPWDLVPGCAGLQARRYADRSTYRYRQRICGKLYVHAFKGMLAADAVVLAGTLRRIAPTQWLEMEEDFWFRVIEEKVDWLIYEMQPE